ncbi:NUDIX domain-containing protein [Parafrankia elaeagni]|uniref:NUDIX domain-containing protein n=1 Tax=Parafrankia elaeagni TaxID=222534 RepID=UPI000381D5AE|nr:NUDIX domain-containing protein [Parafrankia elaeagni]
MYPSRSHCLPVDLRLIIIRDGAVLLTPGRTGPPERPAQAWRLPGAPLRLGEPARETALRLAAEVAGIRANESELMLAHAAHHQLGGGEQVSLYFLPPTCGLPQPTERPADGAREHWRPLGDLPTGLDPLDQAVLACWQRAESYSEPGWNPVRPPSPGGLSPLPALRAR